MVADGRDAGDMGTGDAHGHDEPLDGGATAGRDASSGVAVDGSLPDDGDAGELIARYDELVDPFIGTGGTRNLNCFPGAVLPWGMVAASPDTTSDGSVNAASHAAGYLSEDPYIQGFSHTRLQGTSMPDIGSVLLVPAVGAREGLITEASYRSPYDKASEEASAGYYVLHFDMSAEPSDWGKDFGSF
jgi:putative alpha-1,2-mannosidase